jgi:hypothetical protein
MKSLFAKLALILIVMAVTNYYGKARAAEWKQFAEAPTGIFEYEAASITSTPQGFVRVWIHNVTKQETGLLEFNCKKRSYHVLDIIQYDETKRIKNRETYYDDPTSHWSDISPKSVMEPLYEIVCP